ncbi:MAG: cupin domain-containing protein [Bacteroidetes bacterium]|nr:cupin domain-containing protein [Bacteroidota bacterium]
MKHSPLTAKDVIELLELEPLEPEGGYFRETYRTHETIAKSGLPVRYKSNRAFSTAIYYLLTPDTFSALHTVASDEIFHFYLGDTVEMLQLLPNGFGRIVKIGTDLAAGERPQVIVPHGTMQGCRLANGGSFALMGCTVAPGFDYEDFALGNRDRLIEAYPAFSAQIERLTT